MPNGADDQPKRHLCARCGKQIVGVIPRWDGGNPICRDCAFAGPVKVPFPRRPKPKKNNGSERVGRENRLRRAVAVGTGVFLILLIIILWTVPTVLAPMDPPDITYEGAAELDRKGQLCVASLTVLSRYLSDGAISWPTRLCPASGKNYIISREPGEVTIHCPNPGEHGLSRMWVSLKKPVVQVEK